MTRTGAIVSLALALAAGPATPALAASDYPSYPVQFIITFPPGGPGDTTIRLIHPTLQKHLGGPIELVNRPGGGGAAGFTYVAKAKADGYTLLSTMSPPLTVGTALGSLGFSLDDFQYIGAYAFDDTAIISRPDPRWKTFDEMLAYAKANPGKLAYGTSGAATAPYLVMEAIKRLRGVDLAVVQHAGSGPVRSAVLGGHVDVGVAVFGTMRELVRAGKLVALALAADQRDPQFPEVPTLKEKGLGEAAINLWAGLWAPRGTPRPIAEKIAEALERAAKDPEVVKKLQGAGYRPAWIPGGAMRGMAQRDHEAALKVVRALKIERN